MTNPFLSAWLEVSAHLPLEWKRLYLKEARIMFYAGANVARALSSEAAAKMEGEAYMQFEDAIDAELKQFLSMEYLNSFPSEGVKQ